MIPPTVVPASATHTISFCIGPAINENDRRIIGAIFCHVDKIKQFIHDNDAITDGNHKWHGAAPNFNRRDDNKISDARVLFIIILINKDDPRRRSIDPNAWDRKYLIAASVS